MLHNYEMAMGLSHVIPEISAHYAAHSLYVCPMNNDLRAYMVTKLRARISVGLQLTLALPEENPDIWTQVLLQGHPEELGVDFKIKKINKKCRSGLSQLPLMRILVQVHHFRLYGSLRLKQNNSSRT